ncbi:hypothetical protein GCM10009601_32390 [Streptomyces thermospinosisporus]|uniref:Uncharacterized protein n=1 Tax=Streptomyces thermospinosisporus TaxID=161482 RepID=A0ABP4JMU2_9ACTN
MPPENKRKKPAAQPRRIKEFEGVRSKPRKSSARPTKPKGTAEQSPRQRQTAGTQAQESRTPVASPGNEAQDRSGKGVGTEPLVDPRSDPEVMFRILSEKIATKVDRAAMKAGTSVAQEVGRKLTAELDAAIAGAQSTAGKLGTLVQQAVQTAVDEALRTAVMNATRIHEEHLAQLALIDRTAQTAQDLDAVRLRIEQEMRRSGLTRITDPDPASFNLVNPAEHEGSTAYEVLAPAYADSASGRIVQRGEMRRVPQGAGDSAAEGSSR